MPIEDTRTEIAILKKDLDLLASLSEKFDIAIDRLTVVATTVDKMLAVHETRLENQEKQSQLIQDRLSTFKKELMDEILDLKKENDVQHQSVKDRIDKLEKWRWFIMGISAAIGFLLARSDILLKFLV